MAHSAKPKCTVEECKNKALISEGIKKPKRLL
jgi:hypothetical protein